MEPLARSQHVGTCLEQDLEVAQAAAGVDPSVGSVGDAYDNSFAETVIGLFMYQGDHTATTLQEHAPGQVRRPRTSTTTIACATAAATSHRPNSKPVSTVTTGPSPGPDIRQPEPPNTPGRFSLRSASTCVGPTPHSHQERIRQPSSPRFRGNDSGNRRRSQCVPLRTRNPFAPS